jgi:hypothetical protein
MANMKIKYAILIKILMVVSLSIHAEETQSLNKGWFVGGLVGHGSVEIKKPTHTNDQDKVTTAGIYGGYHFNDWFALEASLYGTGELADDEANLVSAHLALFTFTPKFIYEANKSLAFSARVGLAYMSYEEEYNNYILNQRDSDQLWRGSGVVLGLDASVILSNSLVGRISYDRVIGSLEEVEEWYLNNTPDVDVDLEQISIGIHYHF